MPLVRVTAIPGVRNLRDIGIALSEIVPAAMNSKDGPLTPDSICYMTSHTDLDSASLLTVDVFIEVEAYYYEDRKVNLDERAELIREAMRSCLPGYTYAVWPKLVTAGWSREVEDPDFNGDMSISAAISRASKRLGLDKGPTSRESPLGD